MNFKGLFNDQVDKVGAGDYLYITDSFDLSLNIISCERKSIALGDDFTLEALPEHIQGHDIQYCKWIWCYYTGNYAEKDKEKQRIKAFFPGAQQHLFEGGTFHKKEYLQESEHVEELKKVLAGIESRLLPLSNTNRDYYERDDAGKIKGIIDVYIQEDICEREQPFIMGGIPYLYSHGLYKADTSGTRLKEMIKECLMPKYKKDPLIKRVYNLFYTVTAIQTEFKDVNQYPDYWINFKNGFYDPKEKKFIEHGKEYKAINQIQHEYNPNAEDTDGKIEEWLQFTIPDPEDREMFLQYAGYMLTRDMSQQVFLILNGEGGTGKSIIIRLLEYMVGSDNVSNIPLDGLSQRFATYGLMGKLLNSCADLKITCIEDSSILKKCMGEDTLIAEQKGKDAISFKSYAKMVFSANELPTFKNEKTNGTYRRILSLAINRKPAKVDPYLIDSLKSNISYFIRLCVEALQRMYQSGNILKSSNSIKAVDQVRTNSDSVQAFISEKCVLGADFKIPRADLFDCYVDYCIESERMRVKKTTFYNSLILKGFKDIKINGYRYFQGLQICSEWVPADITPFSKGSYRAPKGHLA